jgi:pyrroline-5-carboxylate reductase
MTSTLAIIGCGNLGSALANGLLSQPEFSPQRLRLSKRDVSTLSDFESRGVAVFSDNLEACRGADIIILGVKPYNIAQVLQEIGPHLAVNRQQVVSLATGITLAEMEAHLPKGMRLHRAMPNIAADVRESITCICSKNASTTDIHSVSVLFRAIGETLPIEESLMEAATVLGACGIAYVLRFMRAMIQGGIQIGFDARTAHAIVNQTVKGAAEMMIQQHIHPEEAIDKVTTPKGCTIVGLNEMEHHGFSAAMVKGVLASFEKIEKV